MSRIYSQRSIDELQTIFVNNRTDKYELNKLRQELSYRSSARAKRLLKQVEALLPPLQTNAHLIKQPTRETPAQVAIPVDKEIAEYQRIFGIELIQMRESLFKSVNELSSLAASKNQVASTIGDALNRLRSNLREHVASIVPEATRDPEGPTTEYERRKQLTRVTLVQQATRSFPDYSRLEPLEDSYRKASRESDQTLQELQKVRTSLAKLDEFISKNELQLQIEIENQVVKMIAKQIVDGTEDIRLLENVRLFKLADPVGVLTRAHMYANSVLQTSRDA